MKVWAGRFFIVMNLAPLTVQLQAVLTPLRQLASQVIQQTLAMQVLAAMEVVALAVMAGILLRFLLF